jgi:hypothetical protein
MESHKDNASRLEMGRRLIAEQRKRIERQRRLVSDLEARGRHDRVLREASVHLRQMIRNLDLMLVKFQRIEGRRTG